MKIFKMLSFEPRGSLRPEGGAGSVRKFEEEVYAKVYRYVVVKAKPRQYHSKCLWFSLHVVRLDRMLTLKQSNYYK